MKTKEEILKEVTFGNDPSEFITYDEAIKAMQLYSDQQNKEMRESLTAETNRANALRDRLKQEHDDLVNERANGRIEWERLRMEDKAEIQRLTKEVEELKANRIATIGPSPIHAMTDKITRLRELLGEIKKAIVEDAIHWEPSAANKLLTNIDNALNPKP